MTKQSWYYERFSCDEVSGVYAVSSGACFYGGGTGTQGESSATQQFMKDQNPMSARMGGSM